MTLLHALWIIFFFSFIWFLPPDFHLICLGNEEEKGNKQPLRGEVLLWYVYYLNSDSSFKAWDFFKWTNFTSHCYYYYYAYGLGSHKENFVFFKCHTVSMILKKKHLLEHDDSRSHKQSISIQACHYIHPCLVIELAYTICHIGSFLFLVK